jgi:hypothetical protein
MALTVALLDTPEQNLAFQQGAFKRYGYLLDAAERNMWAWWRRLGPIGKVRGVSENPHHAIAWRCGGVSKT